MIDRSDSNLDWDAFWRAWKCDPLQAVHNPQDWGQLSWKFALESWEALFSRLAPGGNLLECGCGSAIVSRYMARHGYYCTLVDYSSEGVRLARSRMRSEGWEGQFIVGDINRLPLSDESFDIVYSGGVLEFFDDIERPIREMIRVLRRGGVFAATMVPRKFSIQTVADWQRTLAHSVRNLLRGRLRKALTAIRIVPSHYHVNTVALEGYERSCRAGGLTNVVARYATPFPDLSLPHWLNRAYVDYLKRHRSTWNRFEEGRSAWNRLIGITYKVYGIK